MFIFLWPERRRKYGKIGPFQRDKAKKGQKLDLKRMSVVKPAHYLRNSRRFKGENNLQFKSGDFNCSKLAVKHSVLSLFSVEKKEVERLKGEMQ